MTPLTDIKACKNHPDRQAVYVASMPIAEKVDGQYTKNFFLCEPCGKNLHAIGYPVKEIN